MIIFDLMRYFNTWGYCNIAHLEMLCRGGDVMPLTSPGLYHLRAGVTKYQWSSPEVGVAIRSEALQVSVYVL